MTGKYGARGYGLEDMAAVYGMILLLLLPFPSAAQRIQYIWAFGNRAGLDFNSGVPVPVTTAIVPGMIPIGEACASVCDDGGNLLFYTTGETVWDRTHQVMQNGNLQQFYPYATTSTTQGTVIVPAPDSIDRYYVFSLSCYEQESRDPATAGRLYYSVVDMRLNNGLGGVVPGRKKVLLDSFLTEKMIALPGDNCDVWLLVRSRQTASFRVWHIVAAGIEPLPVISNAGNYPARTYYIGALKASPDGRRLVTCNMQQGQGMELYDFDPASGVAANAVIIDTGAFYSACFSPGGNRIYASAYRGIYQYDASLPDAAAVAASKIQVHSGNPELTDLKRGPDGKIYFAGTDVSNLSVINDPDLPDIACGLVPDVLQLSVGGRYTGGLPNEVPARIPSDTIRRRQPMTVCFRDSAVLVRSGYAHRWDNGDRIASRAVYHSGIYWVSYISGCVYYTDTFDVRLIPFPKTGAGPACREGGNGTAWTAPVPDTVVYTWYHSNGAVLRSVTVSHDGDTLRNVPHGSYRLHIRTTAGCDTSVTVTVPPGAYQASFLSDTIVCRRSDLALTNTSSGFVRYIWNFGDGNVSVQADPVHRYEDTGVYAITLIAETSGGCYDTAYHTVTVLPSPFVRFTTDRDSVCTGAVVTFFPEYTSGVTGLRWQAGSTAWSTDMTGRVAYACDSPGKVPVTLTAVYPYCPDTAYRDTLTVFPYPVANLGTDTAICPGSTPLPLGNSWTPDFPCMVRWSTGDTTETLLVREPGLYWMTVTSEYGCAVCDSIEVRRSCYIDIPNVFTPGGDGVNDYFFPRALLAGGLRAFHMQVFNRWGQVVFETDERGGGGWDGRYNNVPQPQGIYVYRIEAVFENGIMEKRTGNVTLLR